MTLSQDGKLRMIISKRTGMVQTEDVQFTSSERRTDDITGWLELSGETVEEEKTSRTHRT